MKRKNKSRDKIIKLVSIILAIISLFGIVVFHFSNTTEYPTKQNFLIGNKEVYYAGIKNNYNGPMAEIHVCPPNTNYTDIQGGDCTWYAKASGTEYKNIIENKTIIMNEDNFKVIEKGLYFFKFKIF